MRGPLQSFIAYPFNVFFSLKKVVTKTKQNKENTSSSFWINRGKEEQRESNVTNVTVNGERKSEMRRWKTFLIGLTNKFVSKEQDKRYSYIVTCFFKYQSVQTPAPLAVRHLQTLVTGMERHTVDKYQRTVMSHEVNRCVLKLWRIESQLTTAKQKNKSSTREKSQKYVMGQQGMG